MHNDHVDTVHVDGSYGEGGGQVVRTSLSLAALLGRGLVVERIRAGRSKPGLAAQHVTCVRAVAAICQAEVSGDEVGSQTLTFRPGRPQAGRYRFDVADVRPSAGAASLVLQTLLPPLLFADGPSEVTVRGGTNVPWSPPAEFLEHAFLPALRRAGVEVIVRRTRGGWYPAGGGELVATIQPLRGPLRALVLAARGELQSATVVTTVSSGLPEHIARRQAEAAVQCLPEEVRHKARVVTTRPQGGPGTCLCVAAEFDAGNAATSALGARGKPAEQVGREAGEAFREFFQSGAAVDLHLADQLLIYAALAEGPSQILAEARTNHLETNAWVIQQFLDAQVVLDGDRPVTVTVRGVGFPGA